MDATRSTALSLTREEAARRGDLLDVARYEIAVDLRGLLEGDRWVSTSTITFTCHEPGTTTFVDCLAEVQEATLNGRPLDPASVSGGRLPLEDLADENVLVVHAVQDDTGSGAGILRTVDPSDGLVYVWTSFEADDARRAWACFDQPDLKAPHGFTVTAPDPWVVTSNSAPAEVADDATGSLTWTFPDTPPLSTYVVVVNAGPFHEIRRDRGGHSLGLWCRQSLRPYLERDAEELFELTEQGLAFYGERFGRPFGQERYDHVFVPNMGGAMENWGCVTWSDSSLHRSEPTRQMRGLTANILLHEMAHMWFGDLVTMRWWDDLWLNEAFASWAATWCQAEATRYTEAWATFLAGSKVEGYRVDMGPATHPIRGDVPTVAHAMANFDAISYLKGSSVLKQLVAFVGEQAFLAGLRAYFDRHAWGSTTLADLLAAVGEAAGRDLAAWGRRWFTEAGTDTIEIADEVVVTGPDGGEPRPHHLRLGAYGGPPGTLRRVGAAAVETSGHRTPLPPLPEADLVLPNDEDLTFAAVRPDPASWRTLLDRAGDLPDPLSRALAVTTGWDMLARGELSGSDVMNLLLGVLATERDDGLVEAHLRMATAVATQWVPAERVTGHLADVANAAALLAEDPVHRPTALRALSTCATAPDHLALVERAAAEDRELTWRLLARRAERGELEEAAVAAAEEADPDPDAWVRALGVRAARPEPAAKEEAWQALFRDRTIPAGAPVVELARHLWRPGQDDVLAPLAHRYLDEVVALEGGGMLATGSLVRGTFPYQNADRTFLEQAAGRLADPTLSPTVRATLLTGTDTLERMLRARGV
jgi:aminopeptidase N